MNLGQIFLLIALVFFFLAAVGATLLPNPTAWGLCALTLGLMLAGVPLGWPRAASA